MELYIIYFVFMLVALLGVGLFVTLLMIQFMNLTARITISTERRNNSECDYK